MNSMKLRFIIAWCLCALIPLRLASIEPEKTDTPPLAADPKDAGKTEEKRNLSLDATALYGLYNRMVWSGSLAQGLNDFSYSLKSDFSRSNDFGYRNSLFYTHELEFTGDVAPSEKWRFTPELGVGNESYGMFRNPFYRREEKDRAAVKIRTEYTPKPMRWTLDAGGNYFHHRLDSSLYANAVTPCPYRSSDFYGADIGLGWEYVWSAANRLAFSSRFTHYRYSSRGDDDTFVDNELIWNFNVTGFLKFGLGPLYSYNRDAGHFVSGKAAVSTIGIKHVTAEASYRYELEPFRPEEFYSERRYVLPDYRLSPGRGHRVNAGVGVDISRSGTGRFRLRSVKVKASASFTTRDRHYSFFSLPAQVLFPYRMKVAGAEAAGEAGIVFSIHSASLELGGKYEYSYYYADGYVTYRPDHRVEMFARLGVWRIEGEMSVLYRGRMHSSPFAKVTMGPVFIGSFALQFRVREPLHFYGRIDNLFNTRYSSTYGYPEQGRTFVAGVRIVM